MEIATTVTVDRLRLSLSTNGLVVEHLYNYGDGEEWTPIAEVNVGDARRLLAMLASAASQLVPGQLEVVRDDDDGDDEL